MTLWLALVLLFSAPATASVYGIFGPGAQSQGRAGTAVAAPSGPHAAWQNPAALSLMESGVWVGMFSGYDRTEIRLSPRPTGYDPPAYGQRLRSRRDTAEGTLWNGVSLGLGLRHRPTGLSAGAVLYAPLSGFARTRPRFPDEREQFVSNRIHFELLDERLGGEVIATGLSYQPNDWLALGLGLSILPKNTTEAYVYTPIPTDPASAQVSPEIQQGMAHGLTAGALVGPWSGMRLGLSFQDETYFRVSGFNEIQIYGMEGTEAFPVVQPMEVVVNYSPPRLAAGWSWEGAGVHVTTDVNLRMWSRYVNTHGQPTAFSDVWDAALAVEVPRSGGGRWRAGLGYRPSPIGAQAGRTNYVDNDRFVLALGGEHPLPWNLALDWALQFQALRSASVQKDLLTEDGPTCEDGGTELCDEDPSTAGLQTGNPGFPGYGHGGYLLGLSLGVTWRP